MAEHGSIRIPDYEYKERVQRAAALIKKEGLDVLIVNSNEADYANARYFSGFWPLFERCGVAIAANEGDPLALDIYKDSGRALGRGLSILIDILNPEIVVIGSIYQRAEHLLAPHAEEEIRRNALWRSAQVCKIVPAKLADGIGDYAAVSLIAET